MAAPGSGDGSNELRLKPRDSPIIVGRFTSCLSLPSLRLHPSGAGDDRDGCWRLLMLLDCSSTVEWGTTCYPYTMRPKPPLAHGRTYENIQLRKSNFREHPFRNCLENRQDDVWRVLFAEVRRQNRPLCPSCRLMEVPVS